MALKYFETATAYTAADPKESDICFVAEEGAVYTHGDKFGGSSVPTKTTVAIDNSYLVLTCSSECVLQIDSNLYDSKVGTAMIYYSRYTYEEDGTQYAPSIKAYMFGDVPFATDYAISLDHVSGGTYKIAIYADDYKNSGYTVDISVLKGTMPTITTTATDPAYEIEGSWNKFISVYRNNRIFFEDGRSVSSSKVVEDGFGHGYATCSTNSSTSGATMVVNKSYYNLYDGNIITVYFQYNVPASAKLNVNGTGAKYMMKDPGNYIASGDIKAGDTLTFVYYQNIYYIIAIARINDFKDYADGQNSANQTLYNDRYYFMIDPSKRLNIFRLSSTNLDTIRLRFPESATAGDFHKEYHVLFQMDNNNSVSDMVRLDGS